MGTKNNVAAAVVSLYVIVGAMGEDSAHVLRRALGKSLVDFRGDKAVKLRKVRDTSDGRLPDVFAVQAETDDPAIMVESLNIGETRTLRSEYLAVRSDLLNPDVWSAPRYVAHEADNYPNPCYVASADFDAEKAFDAVSAAIAPIAMYMAVLPEDARQPIGAPMIVATIEALYTKRRGRGEARYLLSRDIPREAWEAFATKLHKEHGGSLANDFAPACVALLAKNNGHMIVD